MRIKLIIILKNTNPTKINALLITKYNKPNPTLIILKIEISLLFMNNNLISNENIRNVNNM